jgi:nitroreductase/NAD-dependent dihydropyrimidine dehydrogenase PreA subunit
MNHAPVIDHGKCDMCGKCIKDCPRRVLTARDGKIAVAAELCMLCAHCHAVCPLDAVSFDPAMLSEVRFASFAYVPRVLNRGDIDVPAFVNAVRSRRSIRRFRNEPVSAEAISDLIAFASTAPSGTNSKTWEFTTVNGREKVKELAAGIARFYARLNRAAANPVARWISVPFAGGRLLRYNRERRGRVEYMLMQASKGRDLFLWGAPAAVIVHASGGSTPGADAQYAAYNMTLLAHATGLGTCFLGYAVEALNRDRALKKSLGIPGKNRVNAVLALGHPDVMYVRLPLNKKPAVAAV